jgi:hypothetical protein
MYVNSYGVINNTSLKQGSSPNSWPRRKGHASGTPQRLSHLGKSLKTINKFILISIIVFTLATTAFAVAKLSIADAHSQGAINSFGSAQYYGNPSVNNGESVTGIDSMKNGSGYWTVTNTGRVSAFGGSRSFGDLAGNNVSNIVSIVATSSNNGYWILGADGGVFTFGDARFSGSGVDLNERSKVFVALIPSASERGYNLVDSTGAVFSFGDAQYYGGANGITSGDKIVDVAPTQNGEGYVMVASKGGVFAFGNAQFYGALDQSYLNNFAVAITFTTNDGGYLILADDGGVFTFGDAQFNGSAVEPAKGNIASTDIAISGRGSGYWVVNGTVRKSTARKSAGGGNGSAGVWAKLRNCESHGNYGSNTGNGYYGAYQFSAPTWRSMNTGYEYAHLAPADVQDDAAMRLQQRSGWGQWPVCSRVALR